MSRVLMDVANRERNGSRARTSTRTRRHGPSRIRIRMIQIRLIRVWWAQGRCRRKLRRSLGVLRSGRAAALVRRSARGGRTRMPRAFRPRMANRAHREQTHHTHPISNNNNNITPKNTSMTESTRRVRPALIPQWREAPHRARQQGPRCFPCREGRLRISEFQDTARHRMLQITICRARRRRLRRCAARGLSANASARNAWRSRKCRMIRAAW